MKIAYPYPAYWPYVRRGVERCIHDTSNYLARRGHEVDIITSKPGPSVSYGGCGLFISVSGRTRSPLPPKLMRLYALVFATSHLPEKYDGLISELSPSPRRCH
jgi:hypothetical protein